MGIGKLVQALRDGGAKLSVQGDKLVVDADASLLTDDVCEDIALHKDSIIAMLGSDNRHAVADLLDNPLPPEPVPPVPSYVKRCETCGGTNWGCVGSDAHGEVWGCLTCHFKAPATCGGCGGNNIVNDAVGDYCVDCKRRPGAESAEPQPEKERVHIGVTWARGGSGWIEITNPLTGEVVQLRAKGLPKEERWLFDRLPRREHAGDSSKREADRDYTLDPDAEKEKISDDYGFVGQVRMRGEPMMSGKKWPWRIDEQPLEPVELPPAREPATCPKCKGRRVKHLLTDSMCMACGHRFETDDRPQ